MSQLGDYVKRNSPYISLKDGEHIDGVYKGFKIGVSQYDPEKEIVHYKLELEGFGVKSLQSGALGLARQFDAVREGQTVRILREGEGNQTSYTISVKDDKGNFVMVDAPKED